MIREPLGHGAVRQMLRTLAARGPGAELQHAWLFAGPAGVGKFQVARWWASLLKCEQGGNCAPPCENCRLIAGAVHPDVLEMRPQPKDKDAHEVADAEIERKSSIGVDASRAMIARLSLRATRPGPRVAIVREAGLMTPPAQNALLKLLEEPPGSAVIVLITDNSGAMLTTVRSRCRHLAFGALGESEVRDALVGLGWESGAAQAAAACARGSVARALAFDADGLADRERLLLAWENLRCDPGAVEEFVQELVSRKSEGYGLTDLLQWQLARIESCLGRDAHEPSAELARILESGRDTPPRTLIEEAGRIENAIDALSRNANARLVIRDLLMNVGASAR